MSQQVQYELHAIREMPYGTARTAAAETIARRIETDGPQELLATALLDLVEAYSFSGEGSKSFVVFARALRLWDERPELFDERASFLLFWQFKWIAADLTAYPQITVAHAEAFFADMQRRFELAGHGTSTVRLTRFLWAWLTGDTDTEQARLDWVSGGRDDFDDCAACTIGLQVNYFVTTGRYQEAVDLGVTQRDRCNREPARTHYGTALAALKVGDAALAHDQYQRALASDGGAKNDFTLSRAQGFQMLAEGGQFDRALRVLRNDLADSLRNADTPLSRLELSLHVLAGLSANLDRGEESTGLSVVAGADHPEWATVSALHDWLRREAAQLARAFDERSGSTYFADQLARSLAARRSATPLPVTTRNAAPGATLPETHGSTAAVPQPHASELTEASTPSGDVQLSLAEALFEHNKFGQAAQAYTRAAEAFEREGWLAKSGLALAEAAQCTVAEGDEDIAHTYFEAALPRLTTGQAAPETVIAVLEAWAPVAASMQDSDSQIAVTERLLASYENAEPDLTGLTEDLAVRRQYEWQHQRTLIRDVLARSQASAGDTDAGIAAALRAGEEFAGLGQPFDAAHAFWLAGILQRDTGNSEGAIWAYESAFEGFTVAGRTEERANAASDLIDLLRSVGLTERADEVVASL